MLLKREIKLIFAIALVLFVGSMFLTNIAFGATQVTLSSTAQTETTVTLSWTKSGDLFFSNYKVNFAYSVNGPYTNIATISNIDTITYAVAGLNPSTDYYFQIQDTDALGNANSTTLQVRTKSNPEISITSQTQTTVSLQWSDYNTYSSLMPFKSYTVQMSTSGSSGPWSTLTTITDRTQMTYAVTGLSPGLYYIRMYDSVGDNSYISYSNTVSVYILSVSISASATTITMGQQVQFSASPEGGSGSYIYQWYSNGNSVSTSPNFEFNPSEAGSYNIYAVIADSSYSSATATSNSITVTVKPAATPTPTPSVPEIPAAYIIVILAVTAVGVVAGKAIKRNASKKPKPI